MRRHAPSLAFFVGGFLVALTIIQVSHAQSRNTVSDPYGGGNIVLHESTGRVVTKHGNRLYMVSVYEFEQGKVRSVTLK